MTEEDDPLRPRVQNTPSKHQASGFTMVELMCAIVVLNLLVAGLVTLFQGQNHMVNSLEEWCEGEPVLYLQQDSDPLARSLGIPAILSKDMSVPRPLPRDLEESDTYEVEVLEVKRRFGKSEASALFEQREVEGEEEDEDGEEDGKPDGKKDKKGKKGKKGRGKK